MAYYAIGIGGTGAKCLESLIHLAAAGMMPDGDLYVLFVDPDTANGSLKRARQTVTHYKNCKDALQLGQTPLLKTKIPDNSNFWTPFKDTILPRLDEFFHYNTLRNSDEQTDVAAAQLFEVLYSKQERETTLEQGFRGHPSIGSAVMAKTVKLRENEPWHTFIQEIDNDPNAKVFLTGSIFGGTGASGFSTIARLIKNELEENKENVKLGGALVLPYFYFTFPQNDKELNAKLKAESKAFLMNTQAALKYYRLLDQTSMYNMVYLFGDESQTKVDAHIGGEDQQNAPHFIELYAALAATHFFDFNFEAKEDTQYFLTARHQRDKLQWRDLPDGKEGNGIQSKIGQLARFAFAYLSVYHPMLQDIRDKGGRYRAPWFVDFFEQNQIQIDEGTQRSLKHVEDYCKAFLLWLAAIQNCVEEGVELVNYGAYAETAKQLKPVDSFALKDFSNLILPKKKADSNALNKLWERMSEGREESTNAQGIGKFFSALYQNCENEPGKA